MPVNPTSSCLCCYHNRTHQLQVARISNIKDWSFERVVFPQQRLLFEAPIEAILEIFKGQRSAEVLAERLDCRQLQVDTGMLAESLLT